jgi:lysine-specific demethylase 8
MKTHAVESILRINNPNKKQISKMWKQYQPFIIENVATHWDACNKWSNNYLREHCGDNIVPIQARDKDFLDNYKNFASSDGFYNIKEMKFSEYVDYIENKVNGKKNNYDLEFYLAEGLFEERFPEIVEDVNYPEYLNRKPFVQFWYGCSSKNYTATTPLHFDGMHNLFVQIRGRKKILLFPPSNYLSFYPPIEDSTGFAHHSKVLPHLLDLELFPKFPWQERMEIVLLPGEILYIPAFWWHHVTAVDENISLSFFYDFKIPDFFIQENFLSTVLNIAPHYLYHAISSEQSLWSTINQIKSLILPKSFTENLRQRISNKK